MSDPTYRIEIRHDPHNETWPWDGVIYRISDDAWMHTCFAPTPGKAAQMAQEWIAHETARMDGFTFYTDDYGTLVEAHSVKA